MNKEFKMFVVTLVFVLLFFGGIVVYHYNMNKIAMENGYIQVQDDRAKTGTLWIKDNK